MSLVFRACHGPRNAHPPRRVSGAGLRAGVCCVVWVVVWSGRWVWWVFGWVFVNWIVDASIMATRPRSLCSCLRGGLGGVGVGGR